jgi:hypothetical protein
MARIPTRVRSQRHSQIREPNTRHFIPVPVYSRDECLVKLSEARWQPGCYSVLPRWPEVEPLWLRNNSRKDFAWQALKECSKALGRDRRALSQAGIAARRRRFVMTHPAIEVHQDSPQQRGIIDAIQRIVAACPLGRISQREPAWTMLRAGKEI